LTEIKAGRRVEKEMMTNNRYMNDRRLERKCGEEWWPPYCCATHALPRREFGYYLSTDCDFLVRDWKIQADF
jgi:hypothetical protein